MIPIAAKRSDDPSPPVGTCLRCRVDADGYGRTNANPSPLPLPTSRSRSENAASLGKSDGACPQVGGQLAVEHHRRTDDLGLVFPERKSARPHPDREATFAREIGGGNATGVQPSPSGSLLPQPQKAAARCDRAYVAHGTSEHKEIRVCQCQTGIKSCEVHFCRRTSSIAIKVQPPGIALIDDPIAGIGSIA
jgi:hypothetical protein